MQRKNYYVVCSVAYLRFWFGRVGEGGLLEKFGLGGPIDILTQIDDEDLAQSINF